MNTALPNWITRRIPMLKRSGKFCVAGDTHFDPQYLSHPEVAKFLTICRHVDFSRTSLSTLEGLPPFPHLLTFCADKTGISNFKNFHILQSASSFSFKGTPLSKLPAYHLGILLAIGIDSVSSIDGRVVSQKLRKRAREYPGFCRELVNKGWIPVVPCPEGTTFLKICNEFGVEPEFPNVVPDTFDFENLETLGQVESIDFEELVKRLKDEHEDVITRGQALFGLVDYEGAFAYKVADLLRSHGFKLDAVTDDGIIKSVQELLGSVNPVRHFSLLSDSD